MRKNLPACFFLFLICFLENPSTVSADYWTQKATYPGNGRSRAFCFSIDDKGYIGCGDHGGYASDFWEYDTTLNAWTQKASFGGGGRWSGLSFSVAGFGFAGLGWGAAMMDDVWKYDPANNSWTQMNNFPTGARQLPCTFIIGNKAYISNGRNGSNVFQNDLWEYDPVADSWTQKTNVPGPPRSQAFGFAIDSLGYIGGGFDQSLNGLNDFYEYNRNANAWTARASIPAAGRGDPAGFSIGCMGYTGTGQTLPVNNVLNDFWEFNPSSNQWIAKANFGGSARDETSFFQIGGKGYIGLGGVNGGSLTNDFWEYTPDTTCITVLPVAAFNAANHICPGTCTDFLNLSSNGTSYLWTFAGANPGTSTDVNPVSVCYSTPGNYTVTLVASNAFGSDTLVLNNFMTVYPYPPPQGIYQSGDTLFANAGASGYQWYHNGVLIPGATDYYYVAAESGDYNVVATDVNGCEVEAVIFDVPADVRHLQSVTGIAVFPNPAGDELYIKFFEPLQAAVKYSIYTMNGKLLFEETGSGTSGEKLAIDTRRLSDGIYLLKTEYNENIYRTRFTKITSR